MTDRELSSVYAPPPAAQPWRLEDILPGSELRYFSFGRRALAAGLRAIGSAPGSRVLIPEFICRDLLSSLAAVGAEPVFYPVGPDLAPASDPAVWPQADAVLAVNYFGFPQDLAPFRAYCARSNAALIEDNAHGLFSRDENGRPLGSRGDLGIFSLRKTLPLPDGAALALTARDRGWRLPPQSEFSSARSRRPGRAAVRAAARALGAGAAFRAVSCVRSIRRALRGSRFPSPEPDAERVLPLPELPCAELSGPILAADPGLESSRRRALYSRMQRLLAPAGVEPVFTRLPGGVVPYGFPYRARGGCEARARELLAECSLEPLGWPDLPSALAASAPERYRDVRLVHFLW